MIKKIIAVLMILSVCMSFVSCGREYDESLHNQIEYVGKENGDPSHIIYQGATYLYVGSLGAFHVDSTEDVMLSWNGHRYFGYIDVYESDTTQNPVFIYCTRAGGPVYLREDYDYKKDTFAIGDSSVEIVLEDICGTEAFTIASEDEIKVTLSSKQYHRIQFHLYLTHFENQWYLAFKPNLHSPWFEASDAFVRSLAENGII